MGDSHIEFDIGGHDHDPKTMRLRSWSNIIATAGALFIGCMAFFKAPDETANKAVYQELKTAIEENSEQIQKNHDDIMILKSFMVHQSNNVFEPFDAGPIHIDNLDAGTADVSSLLLIHPRPATNQLPEYSDLIK